MADNNEKVSYGFADNFGFTSPFGENSIFSQKSRDKDAVQYEKGSQKKPMNPSTDIPTLNSTFSTTKFDEDEQTRYIRKVFHKIRNSRKEKRNVDVSMGIYAYIGYDFNLNGSILKSVILQIEQYTYCNIDVSKYRNISNYNPLTGYTSIGINFNNKLSLYFTDETDRQIAINYILGYGSDDFIAAFSQFNEKTIDKEILDRQKNSGLINQSATPLCGIAVIANLIATYYKTDFKYLVKDLFFYAEAFYGTIKYVIKPRHSNTEQNYHLNPAGKNYPSGMPQADYVLLTSIKNSENKVLAFQQGGGLGGATLPFELVHLLTKMMNAKEVKDKTALTGTGIDKMQYLYDMEGDYMGGYDCLMLINSNMLSNTSDGMFLNHWVSYKGGLMVDNIKRTVVFQIFTWGLGNAKQYTMNQEVFINHFYGYVKTRIL
jgi:hypothetical protein